MNYKQQVQEILKNTGFERIHKVMWMLDWKWGDNEYPPSIPELKQCAEELLQTLIDNPSVDWTTCGGFRAWRNEGGNGEDSLALAFELTGWEFDESYFILLETNNNVTSKI